MDYEYHHEIKVKMILHYHFCIYGNNKKLKKERKRKRNNLNFFYPRLCTSRRIGEKQVSNNLMFATNAPIRQILKSHSKCLSQLPTQTELSNMNALTKMCTVSYTLIKLIIVLKI